MYVQAEHEIILFLFLFLFFLRDIIFDGEKNALQLKLFIYAMTTPYRVTSASFLLCPISPLLNSLYTLHCLIALSVAYFSVSFSAIAT
eukprot:gene4402-3202_t